MKVQTKAVLGVLCLAGSAAFAADDVITSQSLEVKERLAALEQIDVTAQKDVDPATERNVDEEIAKILEEARLRDEE